MQFKEIVGLQAAKESLLRSVREGRVSHAQLFFGQEGNGALPLAIAYAQYLSCQQPGATDSCGECPSCRKYEKLAHPDLHFSYPFIASKKENVAQDYINQWREALLEQPYLTLEKWMQRLNAEKKQPNINIAECHAIIKKLSLKSFESDFKVMIIWLPEFLREVGNSLLKLIEEPPSRTLFLLVTEQPDQLLPTLVSRTQLLRTGRLQEDEIASWLSAHGECGEEEARQAARLSGGNLAAAIDLARKEGNRLGQLFIDWMRICYKRDGLQMVEWSEQATALGKQQQKNLLQYGLSLLQQCMLCRAGLNLQSSGEELDFITRFSKQLDPEKTAGIAAELEQAIYHLERNANGRILFLDVSLQLGRLLNASTPVRPSAAAALA